MSGMTAEELGSLSNAQLGALKMVGGDLEKLPDNVLVSIKASLASKPEKSLNEKIAGTVSSGIDAMESVAGPIRTGLIKGTNALLGFPRAMHDLTQAAGEYGAKKLIGKPETEAADQRILRSVSPLGSLFPSAHNLDTAVFKGVGVPEKNFADSPALTLTKPFGLDGNVNVGSMLDEGIKAVPMALTGGVGALPLFAGGVTSDLAGQAAKGTPYEIPARILGGLAGAGGVVGAQSVVRKSSSMLAPFTQGGKERIAQDVLGNVATDPKKAASMLEAYTGDAVPGVSQTAAKVTADPGLLSMENYALGSAGANQTLQAQIGANNAARATHLASLEKGDIGNFVSRLKQTDAALGKEVDRAIAALPEGATPTQAGMAIRDALAARKDDLTAARRTVTQPLYDEVAQWAKPIDARNPRSAAEALIATTKGDLQNTAKAARDTLYLPTKAPDNTASGLIAARQAMANTLAKEGTTDAEGRIVKAIQGETDRALEEAVPAAKTARQEYQRMSVPLEPFGKEQGKSIFDILNPTRTIDPAMVPQSILRNGQAGVAGVRQVQATGAPEVIPSLQSYAAGLVRGTPAKAANIAESIGPGLDQMETTLPGLRQSMQAVAARQGEQEAFQASPLGKIATGSNPEKEIGAVLASKDGPNQVATMVMKAGKDPEALAGLRKGILDDFKRTIESRGGTDIEGNQTLIASKAKAWLEAKGEAAGAALTPEQRTGMKALVDSLDVQSRTAPKMAGSDTVRNAMSGTFMGKMLSGSVGNIPILKNILNTTKTQDDIVKIVADALADPATAKAMLMKYNAGNAKLAEPVFKKLAAQQLISADER